MKYFQLFLTLFIMLSSVVNAEDLPVLKVKTFDGKTFDLSQQKGKIVIVNFWAQWCSFCQKELPILDEIYAEYKSQGVEIIGVSVDDKKDLNKVLKIIAAKKYLNATIHNAVENSFDAEILPTSYIIDATGKIKGKLTPQNGAILKEDFTKLLWNPLEKS